MPKKKNKGGRPTKWTATTVKKLEEAFAMGCTVTEAAVYAGISRETLYGWIKSKKGFSDRIEELQAKPVLEARKVVHDAIKKGDVRLSQWYLERKRPKEFSLRYEIERTEPERPSGELSPENQAEIKRALGLMFPDRPANAEKSKEHTPAT